jgi:hypothetical protein
VPVDAKVVPDASRLEEPVMEPDTTSALEDTSKEPAVTVPATVIPSELMYREMGALTRAVEERVTSGEITVRAPLSILPLAVSRCASTRSTPVVVLADAKADVASMSNVPLASEGVIRVELDDSVSDDGTCSTVLVLFTLTFSVDDDKTRLLMLSGSYAAMVLDPMLPFGQLSAYDHATWLATMRSCSSSIDGAEKR